ncbi:hypothetical protein [Thiomicrorhabdus arctica]|uniref:hypothetical protein n=1 Tax=Thiomicrorhabdus arctica TaxID=131540 RepID=UPI00036DFCA1|nr:hypothetical protein [Thiomicrorhabdus arctica]
MNLLALSRTTRHDLKHFQNACLSLQRGHQVFLMCLFFVSSVQISQAAEPTVKPISQIKFLGLELATANLDTVRRHLWDIGGFLQARTTVRQRNLDKFFAWSNIRDSYYVQFRYNNSGKVTSVKRLYRPYSQESVHPFNEIQTRDIALQLIQKVGQPTSMIKKGWGGSQKYPAYTWRDDKVTIKIDREGSTKLGNVFIEYIIDINDPFVVTKQDKGGQA